MFFLFGERRTRPRRDAIKASFFLLQEFLDVLVPLRGDLSAHSDLDGVSMTSIHMFQKSWLLQLLLLLLLLLFCFFFVISFRDPSDEKHPAHTNFQQKKKQMTNKY